MTKKEILEGELANSGTITLYREGTFWMAYEKSALLFHKHIKPYQLKKTYSKSVDGEVVSLGFPESALNSLMEGGIVTGEHVVEKTDDRIVLRPVVARAVKDGGDVGAIGLWAAMTAIDPTQLDNEFEEWKRSLELSGPKKRQGPHYEQLPVFKTIYNLTLQLYRSCQAMEREFRFTIGEKIKREMIDMMIQVYYANSASATPDKLPYLGKALEQVEVMHLQLRLLHDLGQIPTKQLERINLYTEDISRQLAMWHQSLSSKTTTDQTEVELEQY